MPQEELSIQQTAKIFERYLDENGLWFEFKDYSQNVGYEMDDLGFINDPTQYHG